MACADGRGAQVVRCSFDDGDDGRVYVGKIYDALYCSYDDRGIGRPADVTWKADRDYGSEVAAYEDLNKAGVDGVLVPKYEGSWTFDVAHPASPGLTRPVHMILMEWIRDSTTMQDLVGRGAVACIPPEHRLDILARAMEVFCKIEFHGVTHKDFAPRNVLLIGKDVESRMPDIMLIDFNESTVFSRPNCKYKHRKADLPISPRYSFWDQCPGDFRDWVPEPHRSIPHVFKGWLKAHWEDGEGFSGPSEHMRRVRNFDEPVEFAPPAPGEVDLTRWAKKPQAPC